MIPAPPGFYVDNTPPGRSGIELRYAVAAFTDDGEPLVADEESHELRHPDYVQGMGTWAVSWRPLAPMIPADGWVAVYDLGDGGKGREPLVCWSYNEDGFIVGLVAEVREQQQDCVAHWRFCGRRRRQRSSTRRRQPSSRLRLLDRTLGDLLSQLACARYDATRRDQLGL